MTVIRRLARPMLASTFVFGGIQALRPLLDVVRPAVRREWANAQRLEAERKLYASLRERYEIVVETPSAKAASAVISR